MNTLLDIPKGAEVIDVCKAVEEMMNESEERGELRMLIYFVFFPIHIILHQLYK